MQRTAASQVPGTDPPRRGRPAAPLRFVRWCRGVSPQSAIWRYMAGYDTNLAAEFYVLSCLHRIGLTANLTLGNKKGVDIVVVRDAGDAVTVEVKGGSRKYDWPADNLKTAKPDQHFVALVSFEGRIGDPDMPSPRVWIVPFPDIERFKRYYKTRINVSRAVINSEGSQFENAWHLIDGRRT